MKKVLVLLAVAAMLFGMASCAKDCTCKGYVDGEFVEGSETTIEREDLEAAGYKKCSELNESYSGYGTQVEVKCN